MRLLVCGSRKWTDRDAVFHCLDVLHGRTPVDVLIFGGARGADTLAREWGTAREIPKQECYHANWNKHGRAAGPIRNAHMLRVGKPDCAIAFRLPGRSPGTRDMIQRLRKAGVPVTVVAP